MNRSGDVPTVSLSTDQAAVEVTIDSLNTAPSTNDAGADAQPVLQQFGNYELLEEIARGGMGVVYKARQSKLRRIVALKMIRAGRLADSEDVQRFRAEAEAAAALDHPGIVPVFEVGESEGLHYFSMGFVDGIPLSKKLTEEPLAPRAAAALLRSVALAIQYAHEKGVVHRDLKPGNILLDHAGQPRITDFGLAKRTKQAGENELTSTGQILGTPSYMPPEQALGNTSLAREPADIYALGAVLYAMMTGRPPFQADNVLDTLRMVLEREPVPPRQLNPAIPIDLETICLKCLEKNPSRRYSSAQEVADELERYLQGAPIKARPIGPLVLIWRWCLRNRVVATLLFLTFVILTLGIAASSYFAINESFARQEAEQRKREALSSARFANTEAANLALNQAESRCEAGEANVGLLWMVKAHRLALEAENDFLADACRAMISGWLPQVPALDAVYLEAVRPAARFDGNGDILTISEDGKGASSLQIFSAKTGERVKKVDDIWRPFASAMPIDERGDKLLALDQERQIRIWSVRTEQWVGRPLAIEGQLFSADFSADGTMLVTATNTGTVQFWNTETGAAHSTKIDHATADAPHACTVRFARNGKSVWVVGTKSTLGQYSVADGSLLQPLIRLNDAGWSLGVNPARPAVVVGKMIRGIDFFRTDNRPAELVASKESLLNYEISFQADGRYLLAGGRGKHNGARFWDVQTQEPVGAWLSAPTSVISSQLSKDGERCLICTPNLVEVWRRPSILDPTGPQTSRSAMINYANYGQEGRLLVTGDENDKRHVAVHRLDRGVSFQVGPLPAPLRFLQANDDGTQAIGVTTASEVVFVDLAGKSFKVGGSADGTPLAAGIAADGRSAYVVLTRTQDRQKRHFVEIWDPTQAARIQSGVELPAFFGRRSVGFTQAGDVLLVAGGEKLFQISVPSGRNLKPTIELGPGLVTCIQALPDERVFVARGNKVELWNASSGQQIATLGSHDTVVGNVVLSADAELAATIGDDRTIRIWDLKTFELVGSPLRNLGSVTAAAFSRDKRLLAAHSREIETRIFHVPTGRMISAQLEPAPNNSDHYLSFLGDTYDLFAAHLDSGSRSRVFPWVEVPRNHEELQRHVEVLTGMSLHNQDIRILPRDEWRARKSSGAK